MFTKKCFLIRHKAKRRDLNGKIILASMAMILVWLSVGTQAFAEKQKPGNEENFFEMSLEELTQEPYVVISASRQAHKMNELSSAVTVITSEDIHYSGLTNIAEVLQFTPGVDVLQFDRNTYMVGIRGLHEKTSDRMLTLINGRPADNPVFGGVEFNHLPILLEDIDRIEIVRGPGGAAWGANAFTGVVNIITKKPEDVFGGFSSTTINEFGDSYTHLRWADKKDKWSWRISAGYEENESSDDAIDGTASHEIFQPALIGAMNPAFDSSRVGDWSRNWRFDSEAVYDVSDMTRLSAGLGYSHIASGDYEQVGYWPMKDGRTESIRSFAKIDRKFEDGSNGHLQWSGNFSNSDRPSYFDYKSAENDFEAQYNFTPADGHEVSIGGNFRWIYVNTDRSSDQQYVFPDEPFNEYFAGLFLIDRWQTTERLTIEGQIRGDWYSKTTTDWSGRLTALYALDDAKDHVIRLSTAKAFRTPLVSLSEVTGSRVPHPVIPGSYLFNILPTDGDLENEETWSLEAGYTGKLSEEITFRADTYYQRFEKLVGGTRTTDAFGITNSILDNIDGADSYGAECELTLEKTWGKISAWYAYNDFQLDQSDQSIRSFQPAKHKAGLTGRLFLPDQWVLNANYKFTDTTSGDSVSGNMADGSNRLDLTISKGFAKGQGELMFGVSNLLNKVNNPIQRMDTFTAHETVGRTFFARLQYKF